LGEIIPGITNPADPRVSITVNNLGNPFAIHEFTAAEGLAFVDGKTLSLNGDQTHLFTKGSVFTLELSDRTISSEVASSAYDSGANRTTVTLLSGVLTDPVLKVTAALPPAIEVSTSGFGDLAKFGEITFTDILALIGEIAEFLTRFETFGFLDEPLPLINKSVNDLVGYADRFLSAVQEFEANPAGTLQTLEAKLKQALGLAVDTPALKLRVDGDVLKFELDIEKAFSKSMNVSIPFIGDKLAEGADFIDNFRAHFVEPFRELIDKAEDLKSDFSDPERNAHPIGSGNL